MNEWERCTFFALLCFAAVQIAILLFLVMINQRHWHGPLLLITHLHSSKCALSIFLETIDSCVLSLNNK